MTDRQTDLWGDHLRDVADAFPYPPTPDVAPAVREHLSHGAMRHHGLRRRLVQVTLLVAIAFAVAGGLLAVPQVRAAVLDALNIGAIRILLPESTPVTDATPAESLPATSPSLLDLAGETSLAEARAEAGFPVRLPAYPTDLGPPDRVYLQQWGGPVVILVWLDPGQPERVRLSLHQLGPGTYGEKFQPPLVVETRVDGQPAIWTEGPYPVQLQSGVAEVRRLVEGHALIWTESAITYRLETDLDMEEAVRIAESVR